MGNGRVAGKTAIVTGAGQGLGRAIALRLAEEGARVALIDIAGDAVEDVASRIRAAGGEAIALAGDATEEAVARQLVGEALDAWGVIDILVNNVGGGTFSFGRVWEMDVENWDASMRLNLRPTFLFSKHVLPHMIERQRGRIICLSSGSREGTPWIAHSTGGAAYSTTKAGVHGFIRDMSLEVGQYGITVNAVAPGPIRTPTNQDYFDSLEESVKPYGPIAMTPLHRAGEAIEIAHAVLFLASDEAAYITGTTLHVTGGR